jgi:hypothetical protein
MNHNMALPPTVPPFSDPQVWQCHNQCAEHQRSNDHLNQSQKMVASNLMLPENLVAIQVKNYYTKPCEKSQDHCNNMNIVSRFPFSSIL